jgi:HrpA-like RNA helicase
MLRLSLSSTVLRLKVLAAEVDEGSPFRCPTEALAKALQPPPERAVRDAVSGLVRDGALAIAASVG